MNAPTRRQALVTLAAVSAACSAGESEKASGFSTADLERLDALVDTILPATETPGALGAGVGVMIAEDAEHDAELAADMRALLEDAKDFENLAESDRIAWMTELMNAGGERGRLFQRLKDATIDRYYATEIGLVDELGYQGNTYLAEFPGCTHDHFASQV